MTDKSHHNSSTIGDFWRTAVERHRIWKARAAQHSHPWTSDEIFGRYKFTNVFRELDAGTLALRRMVPPIDPTRLNPGLVIFNVVWYRMLNRAEHATDIGFSRDYDDLRVMLMRKKLKGEKLFTGCHMHSGDLNGNLKAFMAVWIDRAELAVICRESRSLKAVFDRLKGVYRHVGPFIAYEIVTDLRHYPCLWPAGHPDDFNTWANVGPGSRRGMERLGLPPTLLTMSMLLEDAWRSTKGTCLEPHVRGDDELAFELREVEHWLCEFDKYERARTGQGVPKQLYTPPGERP